MCWDDALDEYEHRKTQSDALAEFRAAAVTLANGVRRLDIDPLTIDERERLKRWVADQAVVVLELEKQICH